MEKEHEITSLRARRKKSSIGITCCFSATPQHRRRSSFDATYSSSSSSIPHPSPRMSPSTWIKSMTTDHSEIKGKYRNFISRMTRHRRHSSADFSYDPLSYALNFDDDAPSEDDEFRAMNFTARLPTSPPMRIPKTTPPFDHNLLRTSIPGSPPTPCHPTASREEFANPKMVAGGDDLRRGFEVLSINMKRSSIKEVAPANVGEQTTTKTELSSPRAAAVAEVRRSLESDQEAMPPVGMSSNRKILVQLC